MHIKFNGYTYLHLNQEQFHWLELANVHKIPLLIHPFRIDAISISVRWNQPTIYTEIYNETLWDSTESQNLCGCGHIKKKTTKFHRRYI